KVHKIIIPETDENAKKLLGETSAYVAIRDDMILVAAGPDALKAIKDMLTAPAKSSSTLLKLDVAVSRAVQLDPKNPNVGKVAQEVFGKDPKGSDAVSVTVE